MPRSLCAARGELGYDADASGAHEVIDYSSADYTVAARTSKVFVSAS